MWCMCTCEESKSEIPGRSSTCSTKRAPCWSRPYTSRFHDRLLSRMGSLLLFRRGKRGRRSGRWNCWRRCRFPADDLLNRTQTRLATASVEVNGMHLQGFKIGRGRTHQEDAGEHYNPNCAISRHFFSLSSGRNNIQSAATCPPGKSSGGERYFIPGQLWNSSLLENASLSCK